jgi:hypothetical protein
MNRPKSFAPNTVIDHAGDGDVLESRRCRTSLAYLVGAAPFASTLTG